ncbi:MAG TPA: diaminopimelate decarboxylase [Candidatus Eisenbacteria bacterium]
MSAPAREGRALALGGVPLDRAFAALRRIEPHAHACWVYDLDAFEARARRFRAAFAPLAPLVALALKANALPALLARARAARLSAEAGSLGELEMARAAGFPSRECVLNGNGRTPEEAEWAAREGVHSVNADSIEELDLLERAAAAAGTRVRVALRVNPGIDTPGHRYVATGGEEAKFGVEADDALAAWQGRARWPHLALDGVHVHVGSQLVDEAPLEQAAGVALGLVAESARRGAPLSLANLGGGLGVDYSGSGAEFPLERYGARLAERARGAGVEWVLEPGRWMTAPVGVLLAEVLWVKRRRTSLGGASRRFVVLGAGMNDLIRPALYHAVHRIVPVAARAGAAEAATVVGPVCESADVFAADVPLPPLEPGDLVAVLDAGAYGAAMSSNYNGRGRLAELVVEGGRLRRARASESPRDLAARSSDDALKW